MLRINNFFSWKANNHNGLLKGIQIFFVYIMIRLVSICRVWCHCHHLCKLSQEALFFWVCLIFYLLSILALWIVGPCGAEPNGTISSDSELLLSMCTSNACSKQASKHGYISGKRHTKCQHDSCLGHFIIS